MTRISFWCAALLTIQGLEVFAGGENETAGARSHALGNASVSLVDGWSVTNNQGALGLLDQYFLGAAYESRYFLPEAGFAAFSFAGPLGGGSIGVVAHSYGYATYRDNRMGLSYGRKLSELISLGVQLNYSEVRIAGNYGRSASLVAEIGMLVTPNEKWRIGAHLYNPTRSRLAEFDDERIPTVLSLGTSYIFSEKVRWMLEVEKGLDQPVNFQTGIEYEPVDHFFLRTGYSTLNGSFGFGLGYKWNNMLIDISNQWDQSIGFGATLSLGYAFGKRKTS
ncbi:MAG: hypothetical protein WEC59_11640 [Salibacteraceae bacterium]